MSDPLLHGPALRVLLIEDSDSDAFIVEAMLRKAPGLPSTLLRRSRLDAGLAVLSVGEVDVVLLDLSLPDSRGLRTFEQVSAAAPGVPVIVMSASNDEALAVQAVRRGAQDYLVKGQVTVEMLARAIRYGVERHRLLCLVRGMSLLDDMTGLYNRRGFASLANGHLLLASRSGRRFHLVFADVDGLKQINDTLGHRMGDEAIVAAACVLKATFRQSDVIARLGGDEFVVLALETTDDSDATLLARLDAHLADFNSDSALPFVLAMSAGVVAFDTDQPHTLDEVLARADEALYARKRARKGGRSSAEFRVPALQTA